nr:PA2778 family cysteine peptidase [Litorivivens lipolytica]
MVSACASVTPTTPPAQASHKLDVPFVEQDLAYCGPAALSSAMKFHGQSVDMDELIRQVYVPGREGSLTLEMTAAVRRQGMMPYPASPTLDALVKELDAGNPVLVLQNLSFNWWPQWHYALVVGYEDNGAKLLLHSGDQAYYSVPSRTFMKTWHRSDYWGLVPLPLGRIPETVSVLLYLSELEKMRETATISDSDYEAVLERSVERWPRSATAQFLMANLLQEQKRDGALAYFQRGLQLQPDNALAWNNFAFALDAEGCPLTARKAITHARTLKPFDQRLARSERELSEKQVETEPAGCEDKLPVH